MAGDIDQGLYDRPRRRLSKASLVRTVAAVLLVCVVAFIVLAVRACSASTVGEIGAWSIAVDLTNRCPSPVYATAGDSELQARSRLTDDPVTVLPSERRMIDLIANAAYEPTRYFLAYQVADGPQVVQEFDVEELERSLLQVDITAGCELVVRASA
ncbi:MAG: hypothetical protein Q8M22_00430 [Actinomycetota bacterium]|nr:hypothetical protein [Actinomycetota bacterium]